jgi:hypothetical protein
VQLFQQLVYCVFRIRGDMPACRLNNQPSLPGLLSLSTVCPCQLEVTDQPRTGDSCVQLWQKSPLCISPRV